MKQLIHSILLLLLALLPASAVAYDFEAGGIFYNITSDTTVEVTFETEDYNSYSGDIVIPKTVTNNGSTFTVTGIGQIAFAYCDELTSVSMPNSITIINNWAFESCCSLTSITIPSSVTEICWQAFHGCCGLSSINIPNTVVSLVAAAFTGCSGLTSITVEEGNPVYDSREGCNAIIETATNKLITGCQTTVIPSSVTAISFYAFQGCETLTSLFIPETVTSIELDEYLSGHAFSGCTNLVSIIVEESNPVYDSRNNCNAIIRTATNTLVVGCRNTIIPNTVTAIGDYAFYKCATLSSIEIPNSVHTIEGYAFAFCEGLTALTLPNSVDSIGEGAFNACTSLISIDLGHSVKSIGNGAFFACLSLKSLDIPESVTSIGDDAFGRCTSLTSATIPNSVIVTERYTAIGWFRFCTNLTSVTIGSGIHYMGLMFIDCPNITSVTCLAETPPEWDRWTGSGVRIGNFDVSIYDNATLYVPAASVEAYRASNGWAGGWSNFQHIEAIPAVTGDADGDGRVSIADLTYLIDILLTGATSATDYPGADVDGDGNITIADVTSLIDILLTN